VTIVWRKAADADRERIFDYIANEKHNPHAAEKLDAEFDEKAEIAEQHPERFKQGRMHGTHEIVIRPTFVMVYRIRKQPPGIDILRVLHTRQQWP
jgi:addiction module RelE/StbE family toxin